MYVKAPGKQKKGRIARYVNARKAAYVGLMKSPFIEVVLRNKGCSDVKCRALFDTGADWSLIQDNELTQEELEMLTPVNLTGEGVCRETIPILGEIWRNVAIGNTEVENHRFIVVKGMVTRVILGIDFWARLSTVVSFDFKNKRLMVPDIGINVQLYEDEDPAEEEGKTQVFRVNVCNDMVVPAGTETFIQCEALGLSKGVNYLLEPITPGGRMIAAANCLVCPDDARFYVRIANVGNADETLYEGTPIGTISKSCSTVNISSARALKPKEGKFNWTERMGNNLWRRQKDQLIDVLNKYQAVFYDGGELPLVQVGVEHKIGLQDHATPIAHRPRRLSPDLEQEVKEEIDELLKTGVIRQSNSPWAAPIVCARKPNGKLRLALDYRGPNAISSPATLHPIPRIDYLLDRLGKARYFTTLDAKSGYYQMPLDPSDSPATAFVVPWGQYEFADRTPFGLKGAGYSFQRMMGAILSDSNYHEALCYLDDVLVWGETWNQHIQRLDRVLNKILNAGLSLSFTKCEFGVEKVQYLGAVIHEGMLKMSEQRVADLRNIPIPKTVTELRRAVGAFNYVHQWIPGFSDIAKPLFLECKGKKRRCIKWTAECDAAFKEVKERLAKAVALKIPNMEEKFTLVTDASDIALGAMLAQTDSTDPHILRPVAFFHKTLGRAEMNYTTTEKELLAVVEAVKRFNIYLCRPFDLITDHRALRWLNTLDINDRKGRKGRWVEYLQEFEMNPIHKSGKSGDLSMADYLSRANSDGSCEKARIAHVRTEESQSHFATTLFEMDLIKEYQQLDSTVSKWREWVMNESRVGTDRGTEKVVPKELDRMYIDEAGVLRMRFNGGRRTRKSPLGTNISSRIVLPEKLVARALQLLHDSPLAGHMGQRRTWLRARDAFWWQDMKNMVFNYVKGCQACGRNKYNLKPNKAPIAEVYIPEKPLEVLQVDFLGPFPPSQVHEHRYILQIQDVFSRYIRLIPCKTNDASTAADLLFEEWICALGYPVRIGSDHGSHFTSEVFSEVCRMGGIEHKLGAPYHHEAVGQAERQNQLMTQVRSMCDTTNGINEWPLAVVRMQLTHNASVNDSSKFTPLELITGHRPRDITVLLKEKNRINSKVVNKAGYMTDKEDRIRKLIDRASANIRSAQKERNKKRICRGKPYRRGDLVRLQLSTADRGKQGGKKLAPLLSKLYTVKEVLQGGWTYRLQPYNRKGREKIRHYNELVNAYVRDGECGYKSRISELDYSSSQPEQSDQHESETATSPSDSESEVSWVSEDNVHDQITPYSRSPRPTRIRQPPSRLGIRWDKKSHDEIRQTVTESSADGYSDEE